MDHPHSNKPVKFTGFELLLIDIRTKLGPSWSLFEECLEAIFRLARRGQDTSAWLEQMDQLLQSREDLAISHQGIQFLLAEKGIKKQPRPARSTTMAPPPLPQRLMGPPPNPKPHLLTQNMQPPVKYIQKLPHSQSSTNYLQQRLPWQPSYGYSPPRTPGQDYSYFLPLHTPTQSSFNQTPQGTPTEASFQLFSEHTHALPALDPNPQRTHSSYNRLPQRIPTGPVPSDPTIPISVGCPPLYEKPHQLPELPLGCYGKVAYFPDPDKPTALREEVSLRTVFFADPTFAHNVEDFFGCNDRGGGTGASTGSDKYFASVDELRAPYDADADDLADWLADVEGEGEVADGEGQGESVRGRRIKESLELYDH